MSAYSQSQTQPNQMPAMNQNYQNNQGYGQSTGNIQPYQMPAMNQNYQNNQGHGQSTGNIQPKQYGPSSDQPYPGNNYNNQYQGQSNQQTYHGQVGQNNQQTYQSYTTTPNKMNAPK